MGDVVPFRKPAPPPERPSEEEMRFYRWFTKDWTTSMKRAIFPLFYEEDMRRG